MATFLKHVSCPTCGSSDALGLYSDSSSYCFSCGKSNRPTRYFSQVIDEEREERSVALPDDCGRNYPPNVVDWVAQAGVTVQELLDNNVVYSPSRQQLIFTFYENNQLACWQARNFSPNSKLKYYTQGRKENVFLFGRRGHEVFSVHGRNATEEKPEGTAICCIVEDCLSAIKIARYALATPCLGSTLSRSKLKALRALLGPSTRFVVWLDSNMYDKAQQIAQRLQLLGAEARVVWTPLDPKYYTDTDIKSYIHAS